MPSRPQTALIAVAISALIVPASYVAWSDPPLPRDAALADSPRSRIAAEREHRLVPPVPFQASRAHNLWLRVIDATPIEDIDETRLMKLNVERHYGKISTDSLNRAKQHETMRFTILFPASKDADIRPGDLVNYWLVGYTAIGRECSIEAK